MYKIVYSIVQSFMPKANSMALLMELNHSKALGQLNILPKCLKGCDFRVF